MREGPSLLMHPLACRYSFHIQAAAGFLQAVIPLLSSFGLTSPLSLVCQTGYRLSYVLKDADTLDPLLSSGSSSKATRQRGDADSHVATGV